MPVSRRQLLKYSLLAALFGRLLPVRAARQESMPAMETTLRVWLDILIPADETPSASQLGVDRILLGKGREDDSYRQGLAYGVTWLDRQARALGKQDFLSLDDSERLAIAKRAAAAGLDTPQGQFFAVTRADAFRYYYARPEGWRGLAGYRGPPQPLGYMKYYRPPDD
jgi:hypothetical protein